MSNEQNTKLLERAAELVDELESHPSGIQRNLELALERSDLDSIRYWVNRLEGELSQENFNKYDVLVF